MKRKLTRLLRLLLLCGIVATFGALISLWTLKDLNGRTPLSLYSDFENYIAPKAHGAIAIERSRTSAVKIASGVPGLWGGLAFSSGTYFTANNRYYVLTVHHGMVGPCATTFAIYEDEFYACKEIVIDDERHDYAIIEIDQIPTRTPIQIPKHLPSELEWKDAYSLMQRTIYTGYPNTLGPLTLRGDVVGFYGTEYMYVFSYAWGGSSGSGVFDEDGNYVGYIIAIDVGQTEFGVDVLENVVLVVPSFNVDWSSILKENEK